MLTTSSEPTSLTRYFAGAQDPVSTLPPTRHGDGDEGTDGGAFELLLVEDDPLDAELVRELVEPSFGGRWRRAERVSEALELLAEHQPDLVLLDIGLPDSQGLETLRAIQRGARDIPIVILTGYDDVELAAEAVRLGAQEYVSKHTMTEGLLLGVVRHSIERHELLREARAQLQRTRRAEQQLRELIEGHRDGMVVLDREGRVTFANPAARELLGGRNADLVGGRLPAELAISEGEITTEGADGETRFVEVRSDSILWHDEDATLVSMRDVTERRRADEMRRRLMHADRLRSIGELAAGVAHEINNPAAYVLANTEALIDGLTEIRMIARELHAAASESRCAELFERLDALCSELEEIAADDRAGMLRVRSIVRSLRVYSRIDRDEVAAVALHALVDDACSMVSNEIRHRARLVRDLEEVPSIVGDPAKLTQVVVNLLVNAAHAVGDDRPDNRILVRTFSSDDGIALEVEDTGPGIPQELGDRIFEPFFTTKPRGEGTGLGLSISAATIRQHGGMLEVEDAPGGGALFRVRLPRDTGLRPSVGAGARPKAPASSGRILLVDDEAGLLRALRRTLQKDHEVVVARNGREAIELLRADTAFDAIVCDLMMPDMDGVAVCRWLRRNAPNLLSSVALMSGGAITDRARRFLDGVELPVLEKPVPSDELRRIVASLVGGDG